MKLQTQLPLFISAFKESLSAQRFVKITLGNYKGQEPELKHIGVKSVMIKSQELFSFTFRFKTKDITKNYSLEECIKVLESYLQNGFRVATLLTTEGDWQLECFSDEKVVLRKLKVSHENVPEKEHDRKKNRMIISNQSPYLYDLQITNKEGIVLKHAQHKYKQINHYIELLSVLLKDQTKDKEFRVMDMGSGKGYLTFALHDYLINNLKLNAQTNGIEYRNDLVELCNRVAKNYNFDSLKFKQGSIEDADCQNVKMLVALHACDTATDDAISKGILAKADIIVVAPCCHKQIRRQIETGKKSNDLEFLMRHGIYLEREAEMITDSIRALILEYFGYKTKVFEFISEEHTPKNCMITAERIQQKSQIHAKDILIKIKNAKEYFGIKQHYLETCLGI